MKAIVQTKYGSCEVLELRDVPQPTISDDEVLVRVRAASVHADVWHVMSGRPYAMRLFGSGLFTPKKRIPGTDLSGVVEAVGKNVTELAPGDEVFGECIDGIQWANGGAYAEYAAVPAKLLALKPSRLSFEQAASVPTSGYIALHNLQMAGKIEPGRRVLVNGAAGGVGALTLQLAKAFGAQVTAVDCAAKLDFLQHLGADHVLDYAQEDPTLSAARYDLIVDVASNLSLSACKRVLSPGGSYIRIGHDHYGKVGGRIFGTLPATFGLMFRSLFDRTLPKPDFSMPSRQATMAELKSLLEAGKLTPIIARVFPLAEAREAMRYLQQGTAIGKIILAP
jgi:NADPH:quinone reductase-like Zn-dependent oxidoreductase